MDRMSQVLVTGASGGIGAAISAALARRGRTVLLHYQSDRGAAEDTLKSLPGKAHRVLQADLGDPAAIERLWREAASTGPIDALINNAGIFPDHPPLSTDYAHW